MLTAIGGGLAAIGLFFGMGGPLWPDVLDAFDVSKSQFGFMIGAGLALSLPILVFGARITAAGGKFTVLALSLVLLALSSAAVAGITGGLVVLASIMIVRGLGIALVDLTANTLTMDAERITGRHLMGPLHAMFSAGSIAGSGAVAIGLAVGLTYRSLYAGLVAVLLALAAFLVLPMRSWDRADKANASPESIDYRGALASPLIRLCGVLTALSFAGEALVADWTALYLRDERDVDSSFAAACIVAFAIAMLFGRLLNGKMIATFGVQRAIMVQGAISIVGGAMIVTETWIVLAMAGCALAGFGLAGIGPTALSVAGISMPDDPASAAGVTLAGGYIGLAITPIIGGLIADGISTRTTLAFVMVVSLLCVALARGMPTRLYDGN
jgi:fucose permease